MKLFILIILLSVFEIIDIKYDHKTGVITVIYKVETNLSGGELIYKPKLVETLEIIVMNSNKDTVSVSSTRIHYRDEHLSYLINLKKAIQDTLKIDLRTHYRDNLFGVDGYLIDSLLLENHELIFEIKYPYIYNMDSIKIVNNIWINDGVISSPKKYFYIIEKFINL
jgi:hypothetical protein